MLKMRSVKFTNNSQIEEVIDPSIEKDSKRIVSIFFEKDIIISKQIAQEMWNNYCDSINSEVIWIDLPIKDEDIYNKLKKFLL